MFRQTISILLVCIIFLTALSPFQVSAQTTQAAGNEASVPGKNNESSDLRKIFAQPIVNDSPILDAKALERENLNSPGRLDLSRGQKTALYFGIPATVAAAIIIG